jgi:NADPH-dependent 2,4-dienoyl-CoA reductase/sulfur reductase-like enzyme
MRVSLPGIARSGPGFAFRFAGEDVAAWPGETLAAALTSAGHLALSTNGPDERRGVYCGMGACGECTVLVNGRSQRACMVAAAPDMVVEPMPRRAVAAAAPTAGPARSLACNLLIIGAGPAGLAAAQAAAGLAVIIIDERAKAGGQYFKQPGAGFALTPAALDAQFREGAALISDVAASPAQLLPGRTAWSAQREGDRIVVETSGADGPARITAARLIIATGATEKPWPMPGWTLPGVMTTGAAQTLLRSGAVSPGTRVLVAGNGPLNIQLANELLNAGVTVVAVAEQAPRPGLARVASALAMARHDAGLAVAGVRQLARLGRAGVPLLFGHVVTRAEGDGRVTRVVVAPTRADGTLGPERAFDIDALCIGAGFQPQAELARALGCRLDWANGALAVLRDDDGRTSQATVFVAGDGGGLGGARAALAQGALAGLAVVADLKGSLSPAQQAQLQSQRRALATARGFQAGLWALFAPAHPAPAVHTDDTLLCRCEGVRFGDVEALLAAGTRDPGSIKRATRLGMGRCQGRYCGPMLAARLAGDHPETGLFAPRPPFKPMTIADLAAGAP